MPVSTHSSPAAPGVRSSPIRSDPTDGPDMLAQRIATGSVLVALVLAVFVLDELWFAPQYPIWGLGTTALMGVVALEMIDLLNGTSARPSGNTVFGGVLAIGLANWAPHVIGPWMVDPRLPGEMPYDPMAPVLVPGLAALDVRRGGDVRVPGTKRPVPQPGPDDVHDRRHDPGDLVCRPSREFLGATPMGRGSAPGLGAADRAADLGERGGHRGLHVRPARGPVTSSGRS